MTRCNLAEVVFLRSEANCVSSSIKSSDRSQLRNARVVNEGGDDGFDDKVGRYDILVSHSMASVSRLGNNDRWWIAGLRWDIPDVSRCMRRNSRTFARGSRGNSMKRFHIIRGELPNENLPFGPDSRMRLGCVSYSMEVGERRFERCAVEIPVRISFGPAFQRPQKVSKCAPLWSAMLEIRAWTCITQRQDIDKC